MNLINKAEIFAKDKHKNQLDDNGMSYHHHLMQVASILSIVTDNEDIISAGWLHDTLEDTSTSEEELRTEFGDSITNLVLEVTHEGQPDYIGYSFPRLKTKDGIMIKFADRLSNLSRMDSWDEKRQDHYLRKAKFWKE